MIAIGIVFYGVDLPAQTVPGFIICLALGTATLSALGIAATSLAKNEDSAQPIGAFTVVMLSFVSGIFIQLDTLPNFLQEVGRLFPLYHLAQGLQSTVAVDPTRDRPVWWRRRRPGDLGAGRDLDRRQELQVGTAGPLARIAV